MGNRQQIQKYLAEVATMVCRNQYSDKALTEIVQEMAGLRERHWTIACYARAFNLPYCSLCGTTVENPCTCDPSMYTPEAWSRRYTCNMCKENNHDK